VDKNTKVTKYLYSVTFANFVVKMDFKIFPNALLMFLLISKALLFY